MSNFLFYLLHQGRATQTKLFPQLDSFVNGLPSIDPSKACQGVECNACADLCPTKAISVFEEENTEKNTTVQIRLGSCVGCSLCIDNCPTGTITRNLATATAVTNIDQLTISNREMVITAPPVKKSPFRRSLAVRVVSTGCTACDLEINAAGNSIFDLERFGISIVASPRMADALVVTGPVGISMHKALKRTYEAMPEPKIVIAAGSCAISGGVHYDTYARPNGLNAVLPVDVFVPGCPPHPWSIIHALMLAMGRVVAS
jgi:Ni,Fe-hydrogenase III small subunit/NAD-dependent dihydropyrimidine dehydrogenase PreA subunit